MAASDLVPLLLARADSSKSQGVKRTARTGASNRDIKSLVNTLGARDSKNRSQQSGVYADTGILAAAIMRRLERTGR